MAQVILILAVIAIFIVFVGSLTFPELVSVFYEFWTVGCSYLSQGTGILWLFVPRTLAVPLLEIVITLELIYKAVIIFSWIYHKIKP